MSRCEHGEMMSIFCINENCSWREAGGCENCFKRYHSHSTSEGTITQEKLEELYRKMMVRPDPKVKSRVFQEAIYNYFIIMKSQITSSIDAVSKVMTNKLQYPYLYNQRQLDIFNKIKNKEYKKIQKKELKSFYQFATKTTKENLEQNEKSLYEDEIGIVMGQITKINEAFSLYSKAIAELDNSFIVENTFLDKIRQIADSIPSLIGEGKTSRSRETSETKSFGRDKREIDGIIEDENPKRNARDRDRKVSLDFSSNSGLHSNFNEINERKKRLLEIEVPRPMAIDDIKVDLNVDNSSSNNKNEKYKNNQSAEKDFFRTSSAGKGYERSEEKKYQRKEDDQKSETDGGDLVLGALGLVGKILHTYLPVETAKPKLYEETKDVKEKKITVSVRMKEEEFGECDSPIMKKKKTNAQNKGFNLFKIESKREEEEENSSEITKQALKSFETPEKPKEEIGEMLLKDREANSLALLVESLSASAEKAIPLLEAAIKYAYNNLSAAEYLSYLYLEIGKPKECLDVCNKFLEQIEDSTQYQELAEHLNNNKAAALNMLGRYSESISMLEKFVQQSEREIYYKNLGDAYFSIGIFEKAVLNYDRAVRINPQLDEALFNLSVCLYTQGNFHEAQLHIQRAVALSPNNEEYSHMRTELNKKIATLTV